MNLPNGTLLNRGTYKIVRFIKAGGFGCTYEAQHVMLRKRVAIKEFFIKDYCNRDSLTSHVSVGVGSKKELVLKLKKKFIDEARAIAQMSHPHIVGVSDVFEENGTAYYAMDYIDGMSLSQIVHVRGALIEAEAIRYIKEIADALKYVHSLNRLHLDIKPDNIMVRKDSAAILIDFGVSKQYDEISGENTSTVPGYSSGYAPVEQMSNRIKTFTPATDIYALGATLYTLLTGVVPPCATDRADEDTLEPLPSTISMSVRNAIKQAMNVSRNGRIQSIEEFLKKIDGKNHSVSLGPVTSEETILDHEEEPIAEKKDPIPLDGPRTQPKSEWINQPWAIITMAAIVILMAVVIGISIYYSGNSNSNGYIPSTDTLVYQPIDTTPPTTIDELSEPEEPTSGYINGHEWIDLGLSVKWASTNVGANSSSDCGNYYSWGQTNVDYNSEYFDKRYEQNSVNPYYVIFNNSGGKTRIGPSSNYDTARNNWGGTWRMPTTKEFEELINDCNWVWTSLNDQNGYKVIGPNGNSIFLPAAGTKSTDKYPLGKGETGNYWSSDLAESGKLWSDDSSKILYIASNKHEMFTGFRMSFISVRPVTD